MLHINKHNFTSNYIHLVSLDCDDMDNCNFTERFLEYLKDSLSITKVRERLFLWLCTSHSSQKNPDYIGKYNDLFRFVTTTDASQAIKNLVRHKEKDA